MSLPTDSCEVEPASNHSLLLNNIQKIEGISYLLFFMLFFSYFFHVFILNANFISFFIFITDIGMRDMASARDIVSSIISAANKKIQRRRKNQDEIDSSEHDNDKVGLNFFS